MTFYEWLSASFACELSVCSTATQYFIKLTLFEFARGNLCAHSIQGFDFGKLNYLESSIESRWHRQLTSLPVARLRNLRIGSIGRFGILARK
jgi:hypothetical protein